MVFQSVTVNIQIIILNQRLFYVTSLVVLKIEIGYLSSNETLPSIELKKGVFVFKTITRQPNLKYIQYTWSYNVLELV